MKARRGSISETCGRTLPATLRRNRPTATYCLSRKLEILFELSARTEKEDNFPKVSTPFIKLSCSTPTSLLAAAKAAEVLIPLVLVARRNFVGRSGASLAGALLFEVAAELHFERLKLRQHGAADTLRQLR